MGAAKVLVVAGTHGNERNAPWLLEHWRRQPGALQTSGLELELVAGNPEALAAGVRYLDRDLNRSFLPELLADPGRSGRDPQRARELVDRYGPSGTTPCGLALDLHSTTAAMGNSLVLYGRRPGDLALAAGIQARLGLPIYLHEGDQSQRGFLVEQWPCGVVIEVGPVPQGVITATICRQTQLALEAALQTVRVAREGALPLPLAITVHRHLGSLDLPRLPDGTPAASIHPHRQHRDWHPLAAGDPIFLTPAGISLGYQPDDPSPRWPVFINEAAYGEKGIALSLTSRERWECQSDWAEALVHLASGLAGGTERSG